MYSNIPTIGVGIGFRREIAQAILQNKEQIDWCEIITEHYMNVAPERIKYIERLSKIFRIVPHGIDLSIGTALPVEDSYIQGLKSLLEKVEAPWFSDHLCFTRTPGFNIGQLTPLKFSEEIIELVVRKVNYIKKYISTPFLLENITYHFTIPGSEMSEVEFISRVVREADIGILLDVCNLYINSVNNNYNPYDFLKSVPMERIVQLHIAGGEKHHGKWADTHSQPVHKEVFELMEYIVTNAPVKGILLERDDNYPVSFQDLTEELGYARKIFKKHRN